jgi:hypothetical protein
MSVVECPVSIRNWKCAGVTMPRWLVGAWIVLVCVLTRAPVWASDMAASAPPAPRHASHVMAESPEPLFIILLLAGVLASVILIRGPALRRARQTVKRMPGDAR